MNLTKRYFEILIETQYTYLIYRFSFSIFFWAKTQNRLIMFGFEYFQTNGLQLDPISDFQLVFPCTSNSHIEGPFKLT